MPPTKAKAKAPKEPKAPKAPKAPQIPEASSGDAPGEGDRVLKTRHLRKLPDTGAAATDEGPA